MHGTIALALNYRISIEASFGSDIQRDVPLRVLREFLEAWNANVESAHKKSEIIIAEREIRSSVDP